MRLLVPLLTVIALAGAAGANADPTARPEMTSGARQQFERGAALYQAGEYAEAIATFERGQRLDPHPDFLYALAQAYRKQGDCNRAIALYQAFLATRPPSTEAARARANLERCPLLPVTPAATTPSSVPAIGPLQPAPVPAPALARAEDRHVPWYTDVIGDTLLGAGLIAAGVGTTYLVLGNEKINDATRAAKLGEVDQRFSDGMRDRKIGVWCLAGGGALALGALVRYALRPGPQPITDRTVRVVPKADAIMVAWEARF